MVRRAALALIAVTAAGPAHAEDRPDDLVEVQTAIPDAVLDMRYATEHNFTGAVLYPNAVCKLRRAVVERLAKVAVLLRAQERRLLLWDCYRPTSIQKRMWEHVPDARYVADPKVGSNHSRGAAVDLAIVNKDGNSVVLPTEFDEFSKAAHRDRALKGSRGAEARKLSAAMLEAKFSAIPNEWWHFDAPDRGKYPLSNEPL